MDQNKLKTINEKADQSFLNLLIEFGDIEPFLRSFFSFLGRRTDFYHITKDANDKAGMPPGVAEKYLLKIFNECNPSYMPMQITADPNILMPAAVAQEEVIVESEECEESVLETDIEELNLENNPQTSESQNQEMIVEPVNVSNNKSSESYNGASYEKYSWSQNITEIDVTVKLPKEILSSKQIKVNITSEQFNVKLSKSNVWENYIDDKLPYKVKQGETYWTMSEGCLRIILEKQKERWWHKFLTSEPEIDTSRLDCTRPLDELPEEDIAKVNEVRWNQMRKEAGLPTSDQIIQQDILRKAWNMEGSPFANTPFDPSVLNP